MLLLLVIMLVGCASGAPGEGTTPRREIGLAAPTQPSRPAFLPTAQTEPAPASTDFAPTAAVLPIPSAMPTATVTSGSAGPAATASTVAGPQPTARPKPPPPPADGVSEVVESGPNDRKQVALTFDAGADTGYAPDILDLLKQEGIKGSFGMTGLWAEANPDLVKRMVAEGHMLFNHTWDHASLTGENTGMPAMTEDEIADELGRTEQVVKELTGYDMKPYFRPPYGDYSPDALRYLGDLGYYITIWWTCDTHGWDGWDAAKITGYCTTNIKPHEIILLHVGIGASGDIGSLPAMIDFFRSQGYEFVTVEEMLQP